MVWRAGGVAGVVEEIQRLWRPLGSVLNLRENLRTLARLFLLNVSMPSASLEQVWKGFSELQKRLPKERFRSDSCSTDFLYSSRRWLISAACTLHPMVKYMALRIRGSADYIKLPGVKSPIGQSTHTNSTHSTKHNFIDRRV